MQKKQQTQNSYSCSCHLEYRPVHRVQLQRNLIVYSRQQKLVRTFHTLQQVQNSREVLIETAHCCFCWYSSHAHFKFLISLKKIAELLTPAR